MKRHGDALSRGLSTDVLKVVKRGNREDLS